MLYEKFFIVGQLTPVEVGAFANSACHPVCCKVPLKDCSAGSHEVYDAAAKERITYTSLTVCCCNRQTPHVREFKLNPFTTTYTLLQDQKQSRFFHSRVRV